LISKTPTSSWCTCSPRPRARARADWPRISSGCSRSKTGTRRFAAISPRASYLEHSSGRARRDDGARAQGHVSRCRARRNAASEPREPVPGRSPAAAPNFTPHEFSYTSDLYPFDVELRSLDQYVAANVPSGSKPTVGVEPASARAESGRAGEIHQARAGRAEKGLQGYAETPIDERKLNHLGSVYPRIIQYTNLVAANPPGFSPPSSHGRLDHEDELDLFQGERSHYRFFRSLFTGRSLRRRRRRVETGKKFPAHAFTRQTAFHGPAAFDPRREGAAGGVVETTSTTGSSWRCSTWPIGRRGSRRPGCRQARLPVSGHRQHDDGATGVLGEDLSNRHGVGVPFDPLGPQYGLVDRTRTRRTSRSD
jgi:hypothetical protein